MNNKFFKNWLRKIYTYLCQKALTKQDEILKREVVYLASFPSNMAWFEEIIPKLDCKVTIAYTKNVKTEVVKLQEKYKVEILPINYRVVFFKQTLQVIARAKVIIADNYFAFLGALSRKKGQHIVQVWHASGAIKCFGTQDPKITLQAEKDLHLNVYHSYTDFVVASQQMGKIFENSYDAKKAKMHYIGYPRSDFYAPDKVEEYKEQFFKFNEFDPCKPLWLYAPTYRKDTVLPSNLQEIAKELDIQIIEKYHPHTKKESTKYVGSVPMLLSAIDGLITDYSSLPFDYAFLKQKGCIIYYQYDLDEYKKQFGLQESFKHELSGPLVKSEIELKACLTIAKSQEIDFAKFNHVWNEYNDGQATRRFGFLVKSWLEEDV